MKTDISYGYKPKKTTLMPLNQVPDPDFAEGILGEGLALIPESNVLYSPIEGRVILVAKTGHAIGIATENGAEVLIHLGLDTIKLMGKGIEVHKDMGDKVSFEDELISFDEEVLKTDESRVSPVVITNFNNYEVGVDLEAEAGEPILTIKKV